MILGIFFLLIVAVSVWPLISTMQAAREEYLRSNPLTRKQVALLRLLQFCQMFVLVGFLVFVSTAWLLAGTDWNLYWMYNTARLLDLTGLGHVALTLNNGELASADFVSLYLADYHQTFHYTSALAFLLSVCIMSILFYAIGRAARSTLNGG